MDTKTKPVTVNKRRNVVQKNPLLHKSFKLSLQSQKLIRIVISQVDDESDAEFPLFQFKTSELAEALGWSSTKGSNDYIRDCLVELRQTSFVVRMPADPVKKTKPYDLVSGWLVKGKLYPYEDRTEIQIDGELTPLLLKIRHTYGGYFKSKLESILSFRGENTICFFEWIFRDCFKGNDHPEGFWKVSLLVNDMRRELNMLDKNGTPVVYPRWQDFRRYVIDRAVKELNRTTDYNITWKGIKEGRSFNSVEFYCLPKPKPKEKIKTSKKLPKDPELLAGIDKTRHQTDPEKWNDILVELNTELHNEIYLNMEDKDEYHLTNSNYSAARIKFEDSIEILLSHPDCKKPKVKRPKNKKIK